MQTYYKQGLVAIEYDWFVREFELEFSRATHLLETLLAHKQKICDQRKWYLTEAGIKKILAAVSQTSQWQIWENKFRAVITEGKTRIPFVSCEFVKAIYVILQENRSHAIICGKFVLIDPISSRNYLSLAASLYECRRHYASNISGSCVYCHGRLDSYEWYYYNNHAYICEDCYSHADALPKLHICGHDCWYEDDNTMVARKNNGTRVWLRIIDYTYADLISVEACRFCTRNGCECKAYMRKSIIALNWWKYAWMCMTHKDIARVVMSMLIMI